MTTESDRQGLIAKIVRVPAASATGGSHPNELDGYGIVRSTNGDDVFFVSAAAADCFKDLQVGDSVVFSLEPGPFSRAARVWTEASQVIE